MLQLSLLFASFPSRLGWQPPHQTLTVGVGWEERASTVRAKLWNPELGLLGAPATSLPPQLPMVLLKPLGEVRGHSPERHNFAVGRRREKRREIQTSWNSTDGSGEVRAVS